MTMGYAYAYDKDGRVSSVKQDDSQANVTDVTYDASGNVTGYNGATYIGISRRPPASLRQLSPFRYTATMRIMALDIGEKRVGIAISDPGERVASPVVVLPAEEVRVGARPFRRLLEDWEPELLLAGLPITLAGEEGPQAQRIRAFAADVARTANLPVEFADERLSSSEAKRSLREKGLDEKSMRGKVDMIAASIFLQAWLDARNRVGIDQ